MAVSRENINPTRMELIRLKQRIKLAREGHKLLKQKRDALILEFFRILKEAGDLQGELYNQLDSAYKAITAAEIQHGALALESIALAVDAIDKKGLKVTSKNIMGVKVPEVSELAVVKSMLTRESSVLEGSAKIDEVMTHFEKALDVVMQISEKETVIRRLLRDIEKTKRRVNAIEFILIPRSEAQRTYISMRLDEIERESFFALKRIKKMKEVAGEA